jgi:hypothetical protein
VWVDSSWDKDSPRRHGGRAQPWALGPDQPPAAAALLRRFNDVLRRLGHPGEWRRPNASPGVSVCRPGRCKIFPPARYPMGEGPRASRPNRAVSGQAGVRTVPGPGSAVRSHRPRPPLPGVPPCPA